MSRQVRRFRSRATYVISGIVKEARSDKDVSGKLAERPGWSTPKAKKVTIVVALLLQGVVLALLPFNAAHSFTLVFVSSAVVSMFGAIAYPF